MRRSFIRGAAATVLVLPLLLPGAGALAGAQSQLEVSGTGDRASATFDFAVEPPPPDGCDETVNGTSYEVEYELTGPDGSVDVDQVASFDDDFSGTLDLTGQAAGSYEFVVTCDRYEAQFTGQFSFSRLTLDKEVEGDVPEGTTFTIEADCVGVDNEGDIFVEARDFPADGGSEAVIAYDATTCEVTETDDGGAESTEIDAPQADLAEPGTHVTTVTNTFPAAEEEPEPDPEPEPEPEDDPEPEDEVDEEAEAADPVEAQPTYTG